VFLFVEQLQRCQAQATPQSRSPGHPALSPLFLCRKWPRPFCLLAGQRRQRRGTSSRLSQATRWKPQRPSSSPSPRCTFMPWPQTRSGCDCFCATISAARLRCLVSITRAARRACPLSQSPSTTGLGHPGKSGLCPNAVDVQLLWRQNSRCTEPERCTDRQRGASSW
jgi:hypothetical protein